MRSYFNFLLSAFNFQLFLFHRRLHQPQRQNHFRDRPLKHVIPTRPVIQNQTFAERRVEKNQRRDQNDLSAKSVWSVEFRSRRLNQMPRLLRRVLDLLAESSLQRLPDVVENLPR